MTLTDPPVSDRRAEALRIVRFVIVGATGFLVNVSVFALLFRVAKIDFRLAALGANGVGYVTSFLLNRSWTFAATATPMAGQAARFALVSGASAGLAVLLTIAGVDLFGLSEHLAEAAAAVLVAPLTFVAHRLWTFVHRSPSPAARG